MYLVRVARDDVVVKLDDHRVARVDAEVAFRLHKLELGLRKKTRVG